MLSSSHARALLRIALAVVVLATFAHTRADPDLWGHVRFGHDIAAAHAVAATDSYSFASDRAWVNHEWLAEIVMYAAFAAGGGTGLILLKLLLLLSMAGAASRTMRRAGVPDAVHDLLVGLLAVGTFPQAAHVRPQLFSLALFAWLLATLVASDRRPVFLAAVVPIMIFWVNVHGGWIVGAGAIALWTVVGAAFVAGPPRARYGALAVGMAAIGSTLCNPYGAGLWRFLFETVGFGRADISDWQPVFQLGLAYGLLWLLVASVAAVALGAAARRHAIDPRAALLVVGLGVASFRVNRLLAFFAIAVVLLLHRSIAAAMASWARRDEHLSARRAAIAVALAVVVLATGAAAATRNLACVRIDPDSLPEPDVVAAVNRAGLHGRMLTWFDWGEYAIWYFSPALKVSMDGRRETVYSDAALRQHLRFYFTPGERAAFVAALKPDYIWLPARLEVTSRLVDDGWRPLFSGPRSVLLAQEASAAVVAGPPGGPRCFPGP